jgi:hypothetical protein
MYLHIVNSTHTYYQNNSIKYISIKIFTPAFEIDTIVKITTFLYIFYYYFMDNFTILTAVFGAVLTLGGVFYLMYPKFTTPWDEKILSRRYKNYKSSKEYEMTQKMKAVFCLVVGLVAIGVVFLVK